MFHVLKDGTDIGKEQLDGRHGTSVQVTITSGTLAYVENLQ